VWFEAVAPSEIAKLWVEVKEARHLASRFQNRAAVRDLLNYAKALETDARRWERGVRNPEDC
jgi:hypothetical protein